MSKILNLTQHAATSQQIAAGVVDLPPDEAASWRQLITFENPESIEQQMREALRWAEEAVKRHGADKAMIGGAPFLNGPLADRLADAGVEPVYAFSVRCSVEQMQPDGTVVKQNVFRFSGFVPDFGAKFRDENRAMPIPQRYRGR